MRFRKPRVTQEIAGRQVAGAAACALTGALAGGLGFAPTIQSAAADGTTTGLPSGLPSGLPALPDLLVRPIFVQQNGGTLAELPARLAQNDRLLATLHAAMHATIRIAAAPCAECRPAPLPVSVSRST